MHVRLATGALYRKELRQVLRGVAALIVENVYVIALCVIAAVAGLAGAFMSSPGWRVGSSAFWAVMMAQAGAATIIIPTFAASLVTAEHGGNTWDILRSAPITAHQVIRSKLLAGVVIHVAVLTVSIPVGAACFLLGGVPLPAAFWSFVVLFAGAAFATALGLYCSTIVKRTSASVPIAAGLGLIVLFVFGSIAMQSPAMGAVSPLQAVIMISRGAPAPLFGVAVPVWVASLVLWALAVAVLAAAAGQRLRHPHRRRQWGVRWQALLLVALLLAAALGSLQALSPAARDACVTGTCSPAPAPEDIATALWGYTAVVGHLLVFAVALLAAGRPTWLDELRARGEALADYSRAERWFGLSLDGGARYALLLTGVALAVTLLGARLWGARLFADHWASLVTAFIPIAAAVWVFSVAARCVGFLPWPRSDGGRKIIALVLLAVFAALTFVPAWIWAYTDETTFLGELSAVPTLFAGVASAFDLPDFTFETGQMQGLTEAVPLPFLTAAMYIVVGLVLLAAQGALRRRWARRLESDE